MAHNILSFLSPINLFIKSEKIPVAPYSVLAEIYDFVMNHVNYNRWAKYVWTICDRFELDDPAILDVSCGTGRLCQYLSRYNARLLGMDFCDNMVKVASKNVGLFWCGDMRRFALKKKVDVILSLYDSMNYLLNDEEWIECFEHVKNALTPNGIFVFDVSTLHNSRDLFKNYVCKEKNEMASYIRKSYFKESTQIQTNKFKIKLKDHPGKIFIEEHRQKIRELSEIDKLVAKSPFEIAGKYSEFSFLPVSENSERVHYVLKIK